MKFWLVPPEWAGETAFLLAGGPSLRGFDASVLRGRRVIAINNSWELAPWAAVLYFCDMKWWTWHGDRVSSEFEGRYIVTPAFTDSRVKTIKLTGGAGLETDPAALRNGHNSGYQAINLAYHFGVRRIVLLGYDMRVIKRTLDVHGIPHDALGRFTTLTHWHSGHPRMSAEHVQHNIEKSMLPKFPSLAEALAKTDVEVINATPGSALKCWPYRPIEELL